VITFDLPQEVAASCLEMALLLSTAAKGNAALMRSATFVHRCYVRAVSAAPTAHAHELRWRRFINALDAYAERCPADAGAVLARLTEIVAENADLLDRQPALAS
jgi:hypothetical protein